MRTHFVTAGPGCELRICPSPPAPLPPGEGSRVRHGRDEIATWFDRLTMSGCASRNDSRPIRFDEVGTREGQGYRI